jgi:hypothetical protein
MRIRKNASWFICTIAKESAHNWEICKSVSSWGIPTSGRKLSMDQAKKGDYLLIYLASKGFIGIASITGPMKRPTDRAEAPWAGGIYRYGIVIPFELEMEMEEPLKKLFVDMKIAGTSITATALRRGFTRVSNADGETLATEMGKFPIKQK